MRERIRRDTCIEEEDMRKAVRVIKKKYKELPRHSEDILFYIREASNKTNRPNLKINSD